MNTRWAAALSLFAAASVALIHAAAGEQRDYTSFQLVYHSDTRGYYRPCG